MAAYPQSATYTRAFLMVQSSDHITGLTAASPTVTLSKAGAAFAAAGGTVTEIGSGWYKIALTTTDTNTLGDLAFHITATSGDPTDFADQVIDAAKGLGAPSNLDAAISSRSTYAGGAVASVTAAVTVGTNNDKTGYALTAAEHTAITGDVWNGARSSYTVVGSFGQGVASVQGNVTGSVASVTGSVGSVTGAVGSVTGNVGGSVASVTGNVGGNVVGSVASVTAGVTVSTNNDKSGYALTAAEHTNITNDVWNGARSAHTTVGSFGEGVASVQGNLTGSVGSVAGNVGGNVAGSVASVTGAVGSVTGNVGGNVTGSIGSLATQAKTDVFTATWGTQLTESYAALHTVPTAAQLAFETRALLAEKSVAGTTVTAKKIDGITPAETFTLNDSTSPTSIARAS